MSFTGDFLWLNENFKPHHKNNVYPGEEVCEPKILNGKRL